MRNNFPPERDYPSPQHNPAFGGANHHNLNNLNNRLFDKSRNLSRNTSNQNIYRPQNQNQNQSYLSDSSSDSFNLGAILNTGEVFPEDLLLLLVEESSNIKAFKTRI